MKFEYIKFHGILSDDMLFYSEDKDGNPVYSFVMIDKVWTICSPSGSNRSSSFPLCPDNSPCTPKTACFSTR